MKIAIIGYGKMGKTIENMAIEKGHQIYLKIDKEHPLHLNLDRLSQIDVAIEFSQPEIAYSHIQTCIAHGIPVVSGTTGWLDKKHLIEAQCKETQGAFFYASNFSIGVNIFFEINRKLAKLMNAYPEYKVNLEEIHHVEKLDAPSGTAISLAEDIIQGLDHKALWVNTETNEENTLSIISKRIPKVPGTHHIQYQSSIDSLEIKHTAHSRTGFAMGALMAAEWLVDKQGIFGMKDLLNLG